MESQDIQKATVDTSSSGNMNGNGEIGEEMDTTTSMLEDDRDKLVEEEEASSSALPEDAGLEELAQAEEGEVDSATSSNHERAKKGGRHVARRQQTSGRSLNKYIE